MKIWPTWQKYRSELYESYNIFKSSTEDALNNSKIFLTSDLYKITKQLFFFFFFFFFLTCNYCYVSYNFKYLLNSRMNWTVADSSSVPYYVSFYRETDKQ